MFHHRLALGHRLVVHHLCRQGYAGYRGLQFVGHVVDKIILYLCQPLGAEDGHDGEDERDEQYQGEDDARYHKLHRRVDILVHGGEVYLHYAHLRGGIVVEEHL